MLNEVELLEEIPYYRTLQKLPPQHPPLHSTPHYPTVPRGGHTRGGADPGYDETSIAIIAPDIRPPSHHDPFLCGDHYRMAGGLHLVTSLLCYTADLGTDVAVCWALLAEQRLVWAGLSLGCVLLSALLVNGLSMHWFVRNQRNAVYTTVGRATWGMRCFTHLLCTGMFYRYLQMLFNCLCKDSLEDRDHRSVMEARKRRNALLHMAIKEDRQTATLGLLHSFFESAPQLILQLYTLAQRTDTDSQIVVLLQGASAASSLIQLAWSITSYNSTLHRTTPGKRRQRGGGTLLQFLWHLCTIGSRACTLALFTREYHFWLFPFLIGHWGVMTVWVMHQGTKFCRKDHPCREYLCNMLVGVAYVIYYLNVKAEPTRYKYSAYYSIVFAENCALMTLWFLRNDPGVWYHIPALVAVFSSFASGIVFMLFYYGFCHRTLKQTNEKREAHCC